MGNGQSVFFPDNRHRHDRAQQLANDCQNYKAQFETQKEALERELGSYSQRINEVMRAFGCADLHDLNRLVQATANRDALEQWNYVKDFYDATQMVDQVLYGITGIAAIVGLGGSIIGALCGGIGFFVGIAATGSVLLAIQGLRTILEAVFGAVNRENLRKAINELYPTRIRIKRALSQLDNLRVWMPIMKAMYQSFESCDSKDEIIARLKYFQFDHQVKAGIKSFHEIANELRSLDERRGAWMNEDPDWQTSAAWLNSVADAVRVHPGWGAEIAKESSATGSDDVAVSPPLIQVEEPPSIDVTLTSSSGYIFDSLSGNLTLVLQDIVDEISAVVSIWTEKKTRVVDLNDRGISLDNPRSDKNWIISFASEEDAEPFEKTLPTALDFEVSVTLSSESGEGYLCADGTFSPDRALAAIFVARYCHP